MDLFDPKLWIPVLASIVAGALIGFEREYHGAPAGFRTHILVCLSSALLMLAAVHPLRWLGDTPHELIRTDPVRMAHGILTGVGFLCGGVIFREGFTIRGLTTAASLWSTAALGLLFGVGFGALALAGTAASLVVLGSVGVTEALLPQRRYMEVKVRYRRDPVRTAEAFRALLASYGLKAGPICQSVEGATAEFATVVSCFGEPKLGPVIERFAADPDVTGYQVEPRKV